MVVVILLDLVILLAVKWTVKKVKDARRCWYDDTKSWTKLDKRLRVAEDKTEVDGPARLISVDTCDLSNQQDLEPTASEATHSAHDNNQT